MEMAMEKKDAIKYSGITQLIPAAAFSPSLAPPTRASTIITAAEVNVVTEPASSME